MATVIIIIIRRNSIIIIIIFQHPPRSLSSVSSWLVSAWLLSSLDSDLEKQSTGPLSWPWCHAGPHEVWRCPCLLQRATPHLYCSVFVTGHLYWSYPNCLETPFTPSGSFCRVLIRRISILSYHTLGKMILFHGLSFISARTSTAKIYIQFTDERFNDIVAEIQMVHQAFLATQLPLGQMCWWRISTCHRLMSKLCL